MAKARTWILIILAGVGAFVIAMIIAAVVATSYVVKHVSSEPANATTAIKRFEEQRAVFGEQKPLLSLDDLDRSADVQKKIDSLPPGKTPATDLEIFVWSPNSERTVRISLPFWLLKLGRKKINIAGADAFDFDRLQIDVNQLERIGPKLLAEVERPGGERVLVWTK